MFRLLLTALMVALLGCSGPDDLGEGPELGEQGQFGLVQVSYERDWADESMLWVSTAQFVRYEAMARDQVARLLVLPLDPDHDLPALDHCRVDNLSVELLAEEALDRGQANRVELLEAGPLQIKTDHQSVTLAPRHFPWILPFISGVIYGESEGRTNQVGQTTEVVGSGGEAVGSFKATVQSPQAPRLLTIGKDKPGPAVLRINTQQSLPLTWTPGNPADKDVTYLQLRFVKDKRDLALRCQLKDDGAFELDAKQLSSISGKTSLELVRLRRSFFSTSGLQGGELRVTVRETATLFFP